MVLKRNFARYAATSDAVYLFADIQEFLTREIPSGISVSYTHLTLPTKA